MALKKIADTIYQISLGPVNAFVINEEELILIDTGFKGDHVKIEEAIAGIHKKLT